MSTSDESSYQQPQALDRALRTVCAHFYSGPNDRKWWQQKRAVFTALTWPARWLVDRKLPLDGHAYEELLMEVLRDIYRARKGQSDHIEFFPAYLLTSIQSRWEDFYQRGKRLAGSIDRALLACQRLPRGAEEDTLKVLAAAHDLANIAFAKGGRRPKVRSANAVDQLDLFRR